MIDKNNSNRDFSIICDQELTTEFCVELFSFLYQEYGLNFEMSDMLNTNEYNISLEDSLYIYSYDIEWLLFFQHDFFIERNPQILKFFKDLDLDWCF